MKNNMIVKQTRSVEGGSDEFFQKVFNTEKSFLNGRLKKIQVGRFVLKNVMGTVQNKKVKK